MTSCDTGLRLSLLALHHDELEKLDLDLEARRKIRNEIWLLRNGIDPTEFPDDTWSHRTTKHLLQVWLHRDTPNREERLALLVCTLKHF